MSEITDYQATDLSNCAKLNTANTFTSDQTLNGNLNITTDSGNPLNIFNEAYENYIWIGKNNSFKNQAVFGYRHSSDGSNNNYGLLYLGGDIAKFYPNKFLILKPLAVVYLAQN